MSVDFRSHIVPAEAAAGGRMLTILDPGNILFETPPAMVWAGTRLTAAASTCEAGCCEHVALVLGDNRRSVGVQLHLDDAEQLALHILAEIARKRGHAPS